MFKEMPKYKNLIVLSFRSSLKYNRKGILNFLLLKVGTKTSLLSIRLNSADMNFWNY